MTTFREYAEKQADLQAHEAWKEGKRPLPHEPHDPRFTREYDGYGNVTITAPDGEQETFRMNYELERERAFYADHQHRS